MKYHGVFGTPESQENYRRWLAELAAGVAEDAAEGQPVLLTVAEWVEKWFDWAQARQLYHKRGKPTGAWHAYKAAAKWVLDLYGQSLMWDPRNRGQDFGPFQLDVIREAMIEQGLARNTINGYLAKLKRIWRRAAAKGVVPREHWLALDAVEPLHRNEGGRETQRILSVDEQLVEQTLAKVSPPVQAMVRVCSWSGCRTGEVRLMRTCDILADDPVIPPELHGQCWAYRPSAHKTEHHRGADRIILLGPQAQAVVEPWLRPAEPEAFLFSPYEALVAAKRCRAKTPPRDRPSRATLPSDRPYSDTAIWRAIYRATGEHGLPRWHPHQLRHLAATRLARAHGVEIASVLLGHQDIRTTLQYVDPGVLTKDERDRYAAAIAAIIEHG